MDPVIPEIALRPHLLSAGFSDDELRRMRSTRVLTAIRPGAYVRSDDERLLDRVARHGLCVRAAMRQIERGAVASHASAAVLHGLPSWCVPLDLVHVTRGQRSGGRRSRLLHMHPAPLADDDVIVIDGVAVTSLARTIVDLARSLPFEPAVVLADAALRRGAAKAELFDAVEQAAHRRGNAGARRAVSFADGRSESVGESRSRVALYRAGLPTPTLQWEVFSPTGLLLGRVDFGWPELRTVGEFDGRVKYGRLLRSGQEPGDVVFEEKRREDLLRDEELRVVRWVWEELDRFDVVATRLRRAFERP